MSPSRIDLVPLFRGLAVTTNGTAGSKSILDLDVPQFRKVLPHCEALFLIVCTEGVAQDVVDWNVAFTSGFDRNHELAQFFDIAASPFSAPGPDRSTDYTTTSKFLLESRLQLWWTNHTGVTGPKTAVLSAVLGARRYGA